MLTPVSAPAKRIMSLQTPTSKMSKSETDPRSRILLSDTADEIRKKITAARTDSTNTISYDPAIRPGVSNLLEMWSSFDARRRSPEVLAASLAAEEANLKDLKEKTGDVLASVLPEIGDRYRMFLDSQGGAYLDEVQAAGAEVARRNAERTMDAVRHAVGLSRENRLSGGYAGG
jgi:tryptophanyl-tRNA synthetase